MKHERNIYNFFDCAYSWLVKNRGSYIKAVRCSNRYCKRGNSCALYEFFRFLRICVRISISLKVVFLSANFTKFSFYRNTKCICYIYNLLRHCDIILKIFVGTVDHNRCVTSFHCLNCKFKAIAVIQMQAYRYLCFRSFCFHDSCKCLQCSVLYSRRCCLKHHRCVQLLRCSNDCFNHLHILYIECAYCVSILLCV